MSRKNVKCYKCDKKGHVNNECWFNKDRDRNLKRKAHKTTNSQSCILSNLDDDELVYIEAMTTFESKNHLYDV